MEVTIATWNCCQGTDRKLPALMQAFDPDIAIVPESSSNPAMAAASLLADASPHVWTGAWPRKGLGIYGRVGSSLAARKVIEGPGSHALAVDADVRGQRFSILGVWTIPLQGARYPTPYMGALADILDRHADLLATGRTVVAGDINCSAQSSPDSFPGFFQTLLDRHGLVSAYHHDTGLAFGDEAHPTLFWRHKRGNPFHCDVILVPRSWEVHDVHVGDYDKWCAAGAPARSDHVPVVARVSPPRTAPPGQAPDLPRLTPRTAGPESP